MNNHSRTVVTASIALTVAALLSACGAVGAAGAGRVEPAAASARGGLVYGPGPQATYVVQAQPAKGSCHYRWVGTKPLPDPACTPGTLSPAVKQENIRTTICRAGYEAGIRPPLKVTTPEKKGSAAAYSFSGVWARAEYDHNVPLALGGDPNDARNLWIEPNDLATPGATPSGNGKDRAEYTLYRAVCRKTNPIPLAVAQAAIAADWTTAVKVAGA